MVRRLSARSAIIIKARSAGIGKKGKVLKMSFRKELSNMTHEELIALLHANMAVYAELRDLADRNATAYDLDEFFYRVPHCLDYNVGYPGNYMHINGYALSFSAQAETLEWCKMVANNYGIERDLLPDFEKCEKYLNVLMDYSINPSEKDAEYMEKYVDGQVEKALSAVLDKAVAINDQCDDDYYLADILLSCELLDDYYTEDGMVYRRQYDKLIA